MYPCPVRSHPKRGRTHILTSIGARKIETQTVPGRSGRKTLHSHTIAPTEHAPNLEIVRFEPEFDCEPVGTDIVAALSRRIDKAGGTIKTQDRTYPACHVGDIRRHTHGSGDFVLRSEISRPPGDQTGWRFHGANLVRANS